MTSLRREHRLLSASMSTAQPSTLAELVWAIQRADSPTSPTRIVAIDGPGGAGKSTFARRLADAFGAAMIVHTDDFASADNPIEWWPRLLAQVLTSLAAHEPVCYQRYDWPTEHLAEWVEFDAARDGGGIVIIEGVSASRRQWAELLTYVVWIHTPRATRLNRGVLRDGPEWAEDWREWMAAENAHFSADATMDRVDLVIDGTGSFPD